MSERLPVITAKAIVAILLRVGFTELRQRGSHRIFKHGSRRAIAPMHGGDLKPGTLKAILTLPVSQRIGFVNYSEAGSVKFREQSGLASTVFRKTKNAR